MSIVLYIFAALSALGGLIRFFSFFPDSLLRITNENLYNAFMNDAYIWLASGIGGAVLLASFGRLIWLLEQMRTNSTELRERVATMQSDLSYITDDLKKVQAAQPSTSPPAPAMPAARSPRFKD